MVGVGDVSSYSPKVADDGGFNPSTSKTILLLSFGSGEEGHLAGLGGGD